MRSRKTEFMVDFPRLKKQKQLEATQKLSVLYEGVFDYIEREANLREKVRAKAIYKHKIGLGKTSMITVEEDEHFQHWFAFDHITAAGSRMFDLYIRDNQEKLDKKTLEIAGMVMLMHLEPFYVQFSNSDNFIIAPLFEPFVYQEVSPLKPMTMPVEKEFILARTVKLGFERKMIGPPITIKEECEEDVALRLLTASEQGQLAYRKYLKEFGVDFRKYCNK
ncbi:hypothetical protein [Salisediminibacterium halotolerans]|uniref:hypothetical protein n=1 Tax=Salisediminibacterium halotolerans TaxID=517425 RepID=UPI000EB4F23D|nr:hypothetical protein [Salisediminibacterium halotolerans]RLJ69396.1 hypothetical protein BCL39_2669 [Actinophytocola xinjiangensis]RPE83978.1 hypothetical protein EDD67_2539 [Salisediminibacterium halotolerans]TWG32471.1 hypothetical protein BCL52_2664 [Salisediminibacterium halotolerans]GEL08052.1 hypothetical protein SHA02_14680 [Salisediminibacterium halotolerans]